MLGVVLAGGAGTRLYPLTKYRSKPAVPFGGNYRLVDIPISNCLHSGVNRIFVLTQYNSASLNRHVNQTYKFDIFHRGFVEVLASEETSELEAKTFPHGTADAVRKALRHIMQIRDIKYILVLAGDQLYRMNFRELLARHIEQGADITLAVHPVAERDASRYGILRIGKDLKISEFKEKPGRPEDIAGWNIQSDKFSSPHYYASMNMYIFNIDVLQEVLRGDLEALDFGEQIIPMVLPKYNVCGQVHEDYWDDIGTIETFYYANMRLTKKFPEFNLYEENRLFYSKPRFLPPGRIHRAMIENSILSDGIYIENCEIIDSIVGVRSVIERDTKIEQSLVLGNDFYESLVQKKNNLKNRIPHLGIGKNCIIRKAIIDKNCRIGDNVRIINKFGLKNDEGKEIPYVIRDGIIVIPKNTVIANGTVI
ncbi:MAG: glucose-1-phosphate adenylyltransferase [Spirochaetes bacterium GWF1_51_8]|nr:MAG: glucose-1-phosphate adenylyltransferase [Spirochaetes bacterium GWF1_51_8]